MPRRSSESDRAEKPCAENREPRPPGRAGSARAPREPSPPGWPANVVAAGRAPSADGGRRSPTRTHQLLGRPEPRFDDPPGRRHCGSAVFRRAVSRYSNADPPTGISANRQPNRPTPISGYRHPHYRHNRTLLGVRYAGIVERQWWCSAAISAGNSQGGHGWRAGRAAMRGGSLAQWWPRVAPGGAVRPISAAWVATSATGGGGAADGCHGRPVSGGLRVLRGGGVRAGPAAWVRSAGLCRLYGQVAGCAYFVGSQCLISGQSKRAGDFDTVTMGILATPSAD